MREHSTPSASTHAGAQLIVEVEGYDGDDGSISVHNHRANGTPSRGVPDLIYCVGTVGADGILRFNDWGYSTPEEARQALAATASGRRADV